MTGSGNGWDEHRYAGHKGTLRLFVDVFRELPGDIRRGVRKRWEIISGQAEPIGDACQYERCSREAVAESPRPNRFKDDWKFCGRHWTTFSVARWGTKAAFWLFLVAVAVFMVVILP